MMAYTIRRYTKDDYEEVVGLLLETFRARYEALYRYEDEELTAFLLDINIVPKNQADGFYVAVSDGEIVGAVTLKWRALKLESPLDLLYLARKYNHRKVLRTMMSVLVLDEKPGDDECVIDSLAVKPDCQEEGIADALIEAAEQFSLDNRLTKLTMNIPESDIALRRQLKLQGFRTRAVFRSRLIKYFIGEARFRHMVKQPGRQVNQLTIGMFTDTYMPQINGVATSIHSLANELEKMGHKVYIITIKDGIGRTEFNGKILRIPGIKVLKGTDYRLANIIVSTRISKIVEDMELDVIHTHTEFSIGLLGTSFARSKKIPQVHTYHTMYDDFVHYVTDFRPFQRVATEFIKIYIREFADVCQKVIVPTEKTRDVLVDYGVSTELVTIPTGIDFSNFIVDADDSRVLALKQELGLTDSDFVCMNIGRLSKEKKVDAIVNNVIELLPDNPNLKLIVIGDGPEFEPLKKRAKAWGRNIFFLGKVPWEQVGYYYKLGDAFIVASRFETQGLTVIEALSSSVPVICPNDEAFMSIIEDGKNGLIFEKDEEIKDKIIHIMDQQVYEELLANSANSVVKYSSEYFAEAVLSNYEALIE